MAARNAIEARSSARKVEPRHHKANCHLNQIDWSKLTTNEPVPDNIEDKNVAKWVQQLTRLGRTDQLQDKRAEEQNKTPVQPEKSHVVEQLKKTHAHISMWGLLFLSKPHRAALLKLLVEAIVLTLSTPEQLTAIVGTLGIQNFLSLSNEDLSPLCKNHKQAWHITVQALGMVVPNVMIDNGATINVSSLKTFRALQMDEASLEKSLVTIRAYNNTKRAVLGFVELELLIGPIEFSVTFQVIDILSSFNLLLGLARIHQVVALPSSLH